MVMFKVSDLATEFQDSEALVQRLGYMKNQRKIIDFAHVPNEATYDKQQAKLGISAGFPDIVVLTKKGMIYIEMKRPKGGVIDKLQQQWVDNLNSVHPGMAKVCHGQDEAIAFIYQFI